MKIGTHKFGFLTHMAVIISKKSAVDIAWGRVMTISLIRKYIVGDMEEKMGTKNSHISSPRPFPTMRI